MIDFNLLKKIPFMNPLPLLRNAFLALSLGAFLTSNAVAASADERDGAQPVTCTAIVLYTGISQDEEVPANEASRASPSRKKRRTDDSGFTAASSAMATEADGETSGGGPAEAGNQALDSDELHLTKSFPDEILVSIFEKLPLGSFVNIRDTCEKFRRILNDNHFIKPRITFGIFYGTNERERSLGRPVPFADIMIEKLFFGDKRFPATFKPNTSSLDLENLEQPLPSGFLANARNIEALSLNRYSHNLTLGSFGTTNLILLKLNHHPSNLPENIFSSLVNLKELELNDYTGTLAPGAFNGLVKLNRLELNNCRSNLSKEVFAGLSNLLSLSLNNYTHRLSDDLFLNLKTIEHIELNYHPGNFSTRLFAGLDDLIGIFINGHTGIFPQATLEYLRALDVEVVRSDLLAWTYRLV